MSSRPGARRRAPGTSPSETEALRAHRRRLKRCRRCAGVVPPVVAGRPVASPVYLLGQAPGPHEGRLGRPFAYTAGRTLFGWFERLGVPEEAFRERVYMAAVLRCFPGKSPNGAGDRVPGREEIETCRRWIRGELELLEPRLILPVGRLAIEQVFGRRIGKLAEVVGDCERVVVEGHPADVIALPHPSGLSTWHKTEPGLTLLDRALRRIGRHAAWKRAFVGTPGLQGERR